MGFFFFRPGLSFPFRGEVRPTPCRDWHASAQAGRGLRGQDGHGAVGATRRAPGRGEGEFLFFLPPPPPPPACAFFAAAALFLLRCTRPARPISLRHQSRTCPTHRWAPTRSPWRWRHRQRRRRPARSRPPGRPLENRRGGRVWVVSSGAHAARLATHAGVCAGRAEPPVSGPAAWKKSVRERRARAPLPHEWG